MRVYTDKSMTGSGAEINPLTMRFSTKAHNGLRLYSSGEEIGLYAPEPIAAMRSVQSDSFDNSAGSNTENKDACGNLRDGYFWKRTVTLDVPSTSENAIAQVSVNTVPCWESGAPVAYSVVVDPVKLDSDSNKLTVEVWLVCANKPTHILNPKLNGVTPLTIEKGRSETSPSDFPEAENSASVEFTVVTMYTAN